MKRFAPENHEKLTELAEAWTSGQRDALLEQIYPTLPKTSIDYAVMEPAGEADDITVAAVPMPVHWLDVGSWPAFGKTRQTDDEGNAAAGRHFGIDTKNTLVASSDSNHLIATVGCEDLIIIHTPDATLVCHKDQAEQIKKLHEQIGISVGKELL
jgi:mannose-1-phosphate guanylyltransferase